MHFTKQEFRRTYSHISKLYLAASLFSVFLNTIPIQYAVIMTDDYLTFLLMEIKIY